MSLGPSNRLPADEPSDAAQHELRLIRTARREFGLVGAVRMPAIEKTSQRDGDGDARAFEIPGYCEMEKLHSGGQGLVFRARQQSTGQAVAIKVLHDTALHEPREQYRLEREVQILAALNHPNIVTVIDSGTIGRSRYLVMPYVDGWSLDAYVRHNHLSPREIAATLAKVADAVHSAHLRGVIHRDLKPGNVRVDRRGEPKILDFGLAKQSLDDASSMDQTQTGQFVGSLPWASPEQVLAGSTRVDVRSDVYSLGVILYQLLADRFPYPVSGALRDVIDHIQHTEPAKFRRLDGLDRSDVGLARVGWQPIDDELETVALKCLNKDPARRYQSAGDLARDLRHYLAGEAIEAKRDSPGYLLRKYLARHKLGVAVATGALCTVLIAGGVSFAFWRRAEESLVRAGRAEAETRDEAQRLAAVLAFLDKDLFSAARPNAGGRDVTVRQILDQAAAKLDGQHNLVPGVEAELRHTIGVTYRHLGIYDAAEQHLRAGLKLRRGVTMAANRMTLADDINSLAVLLDHRGKFEEAEALYGEALEILRALRGDESLEVANAECNLGATASNRGDFERAEALLRDALRIQKALLGPTHPSIAVCLNDLGHMLCLKRDFRAAEPYLEQAVSIWRQSPGGEKAELAAGLTNLADCARDRGDFDRSEALYLEAEQLFRRHYGDEHPLIAACLHGLARLHCDAKRLDEAEREARDALELRRRVLGNAHPDVFVCAELLALIELKKGDYAAAESACQESIDIAERCFRPGDWHLALAKGRLGVIRARLGRYADAEPLLLESFASFTSNPAAPTDSAPSVAAELARLYQAWDSAEPGQGYDAKGAEWRAKFSKGPDKP